MSEKSFYKAHIAVFLSVAAAFSTVAGGLNASDKTDHNRFNEPAAPAEAPDLGTEFLGTTEPEESAAPPPAQTPDEQVEVQSEMTGKVFQHCNGEYSRYTVELSDGTKVNRYSCTL